LPPVDKHIAHCPVGSVIDKRRGSRAGIICGTLIDQDEIGLFIQWLSGRDRCIRALAPPTVAA
jgi:hypothetical protein